MMRPRELELEQEKGQEQGQWGFFVYFAATG
jgi:hypothetical protein